MSDYYRQTVISSGAYMTRPTEAFQRCHDWAGQISGQAPGSAAYSCQSHAATPAPLQECHPMPRMSGFHLMDVGWEATQPRLLRKADLFTRPGGFDLSQWCE